MSDRRYGVYERLDTGDECPLSSIPDALVEEAAKRVYEAVDPYLDANRGDFVKMPLLSREQTTAYLVDRGVRAALSVLFPGEEE